MRECVSSFCDVWPGIELDIEGKKNPDGKSKRGHLIVIANPKNHKLFSDKVNILIGKKNPDDFLTDVRTVFNTLDECDTLYIPHFHKEPRLSEEDTEELNDMLLDKSRLFKETSDYRSLGVFANFDYSVIIGSDVQNWDYYEQSKFADLRLPVQTFEQFCLLAKKDKLIIDTLLNKKQKNTVEVSPHKNVKITIPFYEDINVIFGQKGTGKSEIMASLKKHYEGNGVSHKYYVGTTKDDDFNKLLKTDDVYRNTQKFGVDKMDKQFQSIYEWQDKYPTSLAKYSNWLSTKDNNKNKKNMKIADCVKIDEEKKNRKIENDFKYIKEFLSSSFFKINVSQYIEASDISELKVIIQKLVDNIENEYRNDWTRVDIMRLVNWSIDKIKGIADKCSDTVSRPSTTGFYEFSINRFDLFDSVYEIMDTLQKEEYNEKILLGTLEDKGDIFIQTKHRMLCKESKTAEFKLGINRLKECKSTISKLAEFESISENLGIFRTCYEDGIKNIAEFIGISKDTVISDNSSYTPSNGERGILLMQRLLESDSDVYLLDEPELGMGNSYITASILPKIKGLAKQRKTIIMATHNANLAVATLPYMSILRTHKNGTYSTYIGNAFSDELKNISDETDAINWTLESMHTLEGGKEAFYGRKDIYESGKQKN